MVVYMKQSKSKRQWQSSLMATVLLILVIIGCSFAATGEISRLEEEAAFERLYEETNGLAQDIESYMQSDRKLLEVLAAIVASYSDLEDPELWELLDSYSTVGFFSRLELLLPDDTVLTQGGRAAEKRGALSFVEEAAQGPHITDRIEDVTGGGSYVVHHYMPVVREGETVAVLFGVIDLEQFPVEMFSSPYGDKAALYIIDGNTGNFLLDTWHAEPGNIWDLGERQMAPGYDHEQLKQGLIDGKTGYVVFVSRTVGEYLYFYYEPVGINNWRVALSVPESEVFADAQAAREIMNLFLIFEAVCFILYFLWMFRYVRRETNEKQRQLDTINYLYEVEKLLFNAHEKRENLFQALGEIGRILLADWVAFWMADKPDCEGTLFLWDQGGSSQRMVNGETFCHLLDYFAQGHEAFSARSAHMIQQALPQDLAAQMNCLTAIPVEDVDGKICGILLTAAKAEGPAGSALLKSVSFSFSMFCSNTRTYRAMKELGEKDALTGLYNRNRYELDLPKMPLSGHHFLACVYVDANGLHELNNSRGHQVGDQMLQELARQMRAQFGEQYTYRIGGDEFLAFVADRQAAEVERLGSQLEAGLAAKRIHISVGIQWEEAVSSMDELVEAAEQKMYAAKRAYYANKENDRRGRIVAIDS